MRQLARLTVGCGLLLIAGARMSNEAVLFALGVGSLSAVLLTLTVAALGVYYLWGEE